MPVMGGGEFYERSHLDSVTANSIAPGALTLSGAMIWVTPPENQPYHLDMYDVFWAQAQESNMHLSLHPPTGMGRPKYEFGRENRVLRPIIAAQEPQRTMAVMIASGILERFEIGDEGDGERAIGREQRRGCFRRGGSLRCAGQDHGGRCGMSQQKGSTKWTHESASCGIRVKHTPLEGSFPGRRGPAIRYVGRRLAWKPTKSSTRRLIVGPMRPPMNNTGPRERRRAASSRSASSHVPGRIRSPSRTSGPWKRSGL